MRVLAGRSSFENDELVGEWRLSCRLRCKALKKAALCVRFDSLFDRLVAGVGSGRGGALPNKGRLIVSVGNASSPKLSEAAGFGILPRRGQARFPWCFLFQPHRRIWFPARCRRRHGGVLKEGCPLDPCELADSCNRGRGFVRMLVGDAVRKARSFADGPSGSLP